MITIHSWSQSSTSNESLALEPSVPIQPRDHSTTRSPTVPSTRYFVGAGPPPATECPDTTDHVFNTALNTGLITPLITPKGQQITGDHTRTHLFLIFTAGHHVTSPWLQPFSGYFRLFQALAKFFSARVQETEKRKT